MDDKLNELKTIIEKYLPIRSPYAPFEVIYQNDQLIISGGVKKLVQFPEDLFVEIYDQRGELIEEVGLKDSASGLFTEVVSQPFESGMYVAQLQYHNLIVTDFFNVR